MMRFSRLFKLLVVGAALLGVVSCGGDGAGFPRDKTLYLGGSQWGDPNTFNPLVNPWEPAWPVNDRFNLMYEPLIGYNSITGAFVPLLGTFVSKDNDKIVVDLNPKAKWSDGQPVTSVDVKFIYELGRRFEGAATASVLDAISEVQVEALEEGGERLTFIINKEGRNNPLIALDALQGIRIVPAHVFERLLAENNNDLGEVRKLKIDKDPVVSGPYNLEHYTNERIVLKRRDDYWGNEAHYGGKLPAPEFIIHPIYKNNDHFAIALQQGRLDASQTFMPRIWLKKKDGVGTWLDEAPYFTPGAIPLLLINTTKAPLNDRNFRRAMAAAISYADVSELAVSGYAPEFQPGLILNQGLEKKYFNANDAAEFGVTFNIEEAKRILAEAGYRSIFRADGTLDHMLDKNGERMPTLFIKLPAGWSDWEAIVKIAEKGLRAAGIDVREGPVEGGRYWSELPAGDFDLIMHKPAGSVTPSLPWKRFDEVMSSRNWQPIGGGSNMYENQGRYNNPNSPEYNPEVDRLLGLIPLLEDEAEITAAYHELNKIFMRDQPAIPLCHLPDQFYEFSTKHWKNWPTAANPYAPPLMPWVGASTSILWHLEPAN